MQNFFNSQELSAREFYYSFLTSQYLNRGTEIVESSCSFPVHHSLLNFLVPSSPIYFISPFCPPSSFATSHSSHFNSSHSFRPFSSCITDCAFPITNSNFSASPVIYLLMSSYVLSLPHLNISTEILLRFKVYINLQQRA